jgi:hypothetical protein
MSYFFLKGLSMRPFLLLTILGSGLYAHESRACNNGTIEGTYGYTVTGVRPAASAPGQLEQLFAVGIREYDGQGNFTQVQTEKGALTPAPLIDVQKSGTYVVNPDCTGTATIPGGGQARFVIVDNGKEIRWIVVSPTFVTIAGNAIRQ